MKNAFDVISETVINFIWTMNDAVKEKYNIEIFDKKTSKFAMQGVTVVDTPYYNLEYQSQYETESIFFNVKTVGRAQIIQPNKTMDSFVTLCYLYNQLCVYNHELMGVDKLANSNAVNIEDIKIKKV